MINKSFDEVIDFAITKEHEAATLYRNLRHLAKLESSRQLLKELEEMEIGHAVTLSRLVDDGEVQLHEAAKVQHMKIADSADPDEVDGELNVQTLLSIAIRDEDMSCKLYTDLAQRSDDEQVKILLLRLANEEAQHKHQLEEVYESEILKEN